MGAKGLKKFLTFLTGLEEVPPLGFSKKIEVRYLKDRTQTLYAETCTMVLKLPTVHTEYSLFKGQFMLACNEAAWDLLVHRTKLNPCKAEICF